MRGDGAEARGAAGPRGSGAVLQIAKILRRIAGMPDYEAHLEHLRQHHPELPIPTRREFYERFIKNRYGDGPTRCC
jgi:uncharacterized short protein YbdD (DUF466 family)